MLKMLENGTPNDVTIIMSDGELKANKNVLIARCPYFARMLSNQNFVEGQTDTVKMMNHDTSTMKIILKHIFSGKLDIPEQESLDSWENIFIRRIDATDLARFLLLDKAYQKWYQELDILMDMLMDGRVEEMLMDKGIEINEITAEGTNQVYTPLSKFQKYKFEDLYRKWLNVLCKTRLAISLFNLNHLPYEMVKDIVENPYGDLAENSKAFKVWFNANQDKFDETKKMEIMYFMLDCLTNSLGRR